MKRFSRTPAAPVREADSPRFLFYTNECVGLGHLRRTLNLATAVTTDDPEASALVITGASAALREARNERIDIVKLPELMRDHTGDLRAGRLGVQTDHVHDLRAHLAFAAAVTFSPSVVVVDKTPFGLNDELIPTLEALCDTQTKIVLGLRDIEDDPSSVRRRWEPAMRGLIGRLYDAVLIYGPESGQDALACLEWTDLGLPVHYVGYVGAPMPLGGPDDLPSDYLLVTAGGGVDGYPMFDAVLRALEHEQIGVPVVMVTGPLMADGERDDLARRGAALGVRTITFRSDMPAIIAGARAVVTMAGYNTVSEVLRAGKPALLIPRSGPSREQFVRATGLRATGAAAMITLDDAHPAALSAELAALLTREPSLTDPTQYEGAAAAAQILAALAAEHDDAVSTDRTARVAIASPAA